MRKGATTRTIGEVCILSLQSTQEPDDLERVIIAVGSLRDIAGRFETIAKYTSQNGYTNYLLVENGQETKGINPLLVKLNIDENIIPDKLVSSILLLEDYFDVLDLDNVEVKKVTFTRYFTKEALENCKLSTTRTAELFWDNIEENNINKENLKNQVGFNITDLII